MKPSVQMEFHISRAARDRYQFDESLFSLSGNVIFANFHGARVFAQKMNARRDLISFPEEAVRAGQINAMGLIDEILHFVVGLYRQQRNPEIMSQAMDWLQDHIGAEAVNQTLRQFAEEFPPSAVYRREITLDAYLAGESVEPTSGRMVPNRQIVLEELLLLWLANANQAFSPYLELFNDEQLEKKTTYLPILDSLHEFFDTQPFFGPDHQNLIDMLRSPAIAVPHSLQGQLEFIRTRWATLLGKFLYRLLSSLDLIKEEEKLYFTNLGPAPARVYDFSGQELETERFSPDREWMPNLVLIAKNSYVWLDQLSKKYKQPITRLDQIPDEELDTLARWGITGLWLIGLWERSMASKTIKQLRGNLDAVASAYSLFSYEIASDLGGDEAYRTLRDRAWKRGIRLASDMVPNHMGIDSRWVIEHPEWFVSLDYSPFPSYTFNGPNLSWDNRVHLYLEDHYYDSTDAAVVFKRVDTNTGSTQYVYHGNDGTSMPWNDTAQLNYLQAEVREAVIQTILEVARRFPIIRFDAAMTLAKKHYQRLWFPEPGSGGDIPSRAEHGLTREQFDAAMPIEFWREVVDRVAREVPDTLLLAEAFWLMEGYFVRTLGMHRVYNSAFMNMLRDEKNQEYRLVIKNTLEFDPEILKRYVNFMNNPDERTAVDQFGKSDKYFGVSTLLATMPGLPMFGHGQVEGFTEKYGMEFRRAYWDERPDNYLVERHEREIFPLLRRRYIFAEVKNFLLYDFYTVEGGVNEDVFAYSNAAGNERALVLYHNKFNSTRGWVRQSAAFIQKAGAGDERTLVQKTLGEGLGLHRDPNTYTIFRDHVTGLEYIRNSQEMCDQGLYAELQAYQYQVFLDFREVQDNEWRQYAHLVAYLNGRGVPNVEDAIKEIFLQPVHQPFRELVNAGMFRWLIDNRSRKAKGPIDGKSKQSPSTLPKTQEKALDEAEQKIIALIQAVSHLTYDKQTGPEISPEPLAAELRQELALLLSLPALETLIPPEARSSVQEALSYIQQGFNREDLLESGDLETWGILLAWLFTHRLGEVVTSIEAPEQSRTWIDEWLLGKIIAQTLQDLGLDENRAWRGVGLVRTLIACQSWCSRNEIGDDFAPQILRQWLKDAEIQRFIGVNRYQGILWFNREAFEELLWWLYLMAVLDGAEKSEQKDGLTEEIFDCYAIVRRLKAAEEQSDYQVEKLLQPSLT